MPTFSTSTRYPNSPVYSLSFSNPPPALVPAGGIHGFGRGLELRTLDRAPLVVVLVVVVVCFVVIKYVY
jgi:hypothetical protein